MKLASKVWLANTLVTFMGFVLTLCLGRYNTSAYAFLATVYAGLLYAASDENAFASFRNLAQRWAQWRRGGLDMSEIAVELRKDPPTSPIPTDAYYEARDAAMLSEKIRQQCNTMTPAQRADSLQRGLRMIYAGADVGDDWIKLSDLRPNDGEDVYFVRDGRVYYGVYSLHEGTHACFTSSELSGRVWAFPGYTPASLIPSHWMPCPRPKPPTDLT